MKRQTKRLLIMWLTLTLVALSTIISPQDETQAWLLVEPMNLSVVAGQEMIVNVLLSNAPVVYGIDVRLSFDPNILEAISGIGPGDFIDPAQSHILQNQVDNATGKIDYALALLNPAPPVEGDGLLMQIPFRAKIEGQTTISIEDGLFGTQAGTTIPALPYLMLTAPPVVDAGADKLADEGDIVFINASFSDPNPAETYAATINWGDDTITSGTVGAGVVTGTHMYVDEGIYIASVEVCDDGGSCGSDALTVTVANVAPIVGAIAAPTEPLQVNTTITTSAGFVDPGLSDTHTAVWNWNDGNTSPGVINEIYGSGTVSGDHTYATPDVYTVNLMVTDNDGGTGESDFRYVVIYDPTGGYVTGNGQFQSPEGAYPGDPLLTGEAKFGFNAKYNGSGVLIGSTKFQFKDADIKFHSDGYEWLVVFGARSWFQGTGTVDGIGEYKFIVTAIDAGIDPNDDIEIDLFRIKIWSEDQYGVETILYDNGFGSTDFSEEWATEINKGDIKINYGQ